MPQARIWNLPTAGIVSIVCLKGLLRVLGLTWREYDFLLPVHGRLHSTSDDLFRFDGVSP